MSQTVIAREIPPAVLEEWNLFHAWAAESRQIRPFVELALDWHAGHLTIEEGRRIEREQQLAKFLSRR